MATKREKAANFIKAVKRYVAAGRPQRDDDSVKELLTICQSCPSDKYEPNTKTCGDCGCKLNLGRGLNKLRWATEACPHEHWDAWVNEDGTLTETGQAAKTAGGEIHSSSQEKHPAEQAQLEAAEQAIKELDDMEARAKEAERKEREIARAERAARREARAKRREARRERKAREAAEEAARTPDTKWKNPDPLLFFDRHKQPATLKDMWRNSAGFLVAGGPSLNTLPTERLRERGIVSIGINNVAGHAPVRAMTWGDPSEKMHYGCLLDPAMMKVVPTPRLKDRIRIRLQDGTFKPSQLRVRDCPNVWGFQRSCEWTPDTFLNSDCATWGNNNKGVAKTGREKLLFSFWLGLRLLHYFGVRRVYLLGVDFGMSEDNGDQGNYAFKEHKHAGAVKSNNNSYRTANKWCHEMRPHFEAAGWQVFNCNPTSKLTAFDYVPFETAYADCKGHVPAEPFEFAGYYTKDSDRKEDEQTA